MYLSWICFETTWFYLFRIKKNKVHVNRDVIFHESHFSYGSPSSIPLVLVDTSFVTSSGVSFPVHSYPVPSPSDVTDLLSHLLVSSIPVSTSPVAPIIHVSSTSLNTHHMTTRSKAGIHKPKVCHATI